MLRFFDIFLSFWGLAFLFPVLLSIYIIGFFDTGSPLFVQERVGRHGIKFFLLKFRSLQIGTADKDSSLITSSEITFFGSFLRKTKLDELPQLWNVLKGDMSLVGPRPNIINQEELIKVRKALGVYNVRPGITGLSQINHIDMSTPELLAKTDAEMISKMSVINYFKYIFLTFIVKKQKARFRH